MFVLKKKLMGNIFCKFHETSSFLFFCQADTGHKCMICKENLNIRCGSYREFKLCQFCERKLETQLTTAKFNAVNKHLTNIYSTFERFFANLSREEFLSCFTRKYYYNNSANYHRGCSASLINLISCENHLSKAKRKNDNPFAICDKFRFRSSKHSQFFSFGYDIIRANYLPRMGDLLLGLYFDDDHWTSGEKITIEFGNIKTTFILGNDRKVVKPIKNLYFAHLISTWSTVRISNPNSKPIHCIWAFLEPQIRGFMCHTDSVMHFGELMYNVNGGFAVNTKDKHDFEVFTYPYDYYKAPTLRKYTRLRRWLKKMRNTHHILRALPGGSDYEKAEKHFYQTVLSF